MNIKSFAVVIFMLLVSLYYNKSLYDDVHILNNTIEKKEAVIKDRDITISQLQDDLLSREKSCKDDIKQIRELTERTMATKCSSQSIIDRIDLIDKTKRNTIQKEKGDEQETTHSSINSVIECGELCGLLDEAYRRAKD